MDKENKDIYTEEWEAGKDYYITRDGEKIPYDPKTRQPPVVYNEPYFTEDQLADEEIVDPDGLPVHYHHGLFNPVEATDYIPPGGDESTPNANPAINPMLMDYMTTLEEEQGKFHIRYYGTVEHHMCLPHDPRDPEHKRGGLIALSVRDDLDSHLHTDIHTYNPLRLLGDEHFENGTKVRVDIQDWDSVIADFIYNYPVALHVEDYEDNPEEFIVQTFLELGQWNGNKKMRLIDFFKVVAKHYSTSLGDLYQTLAQYDKDHQWIVDVPTQIGMTLDEDDGVCLPYSHLPKPNIHGDFQYNPATRLAGLQFNYVDYILKPRRTDARIYEMRNPQLFKAGTIPAPIRPKQPVRLTSYVDVTVRSGCSEVVDEDSDNVDLLLQPDGSIQVDGSLYFQHHERGVPGSKLVDRWRVEIAANSGIIFL